MKQGVNLEIKGRVQGVGFRYFAKQKAELLNISGFVRNNLNGNVYIEAEGENADLLLFIEYCNHGPSFAKVEEIEIQYCPVLDYPDFEIR